MQLWLTPLKDLVVLNGNWVGLTGAAGYGVQAITLVEVNQLFPEVDWKDSMQAFAASNYGTIVYLETSDNNGTSWDIRAQTNSPVKKKFLHTTELLPPLLTLG